MSKKIIALALAALAPAAAMAADSNVTIYGVIDYGWAGRIGNDNRTQQTAGRSGNLNEFAGGISAGNRIGFKGSEDLGNGLKAIFEIEFGFKGDDTNATTFNKNRHSWVGLTGGFGTVLGGRVDGARYSFTGKYDPFKNQTVAQAASILGYTSNLGQADRADNAVVYITPDFAGFKVLGAYTKSLLTQEGISAVSGEHILNGDTPLWAIAGMYDNGPISVTLDYENLTRKDAAGNKSDDVDIWLVGGSYDLGVVKLSAMYENTKGKRGGYFYNNATPAGAFPNGKSADGRIKGNGWMIGASAPFGPFTVMANYVSGKDKSTDVQENDCKKFGLGGEYAFSKRTAAYLTFARINADNNSTCAITLAGSVSAKGAAATSTVPATNGAYGRTGYDIGVRHSF